MSSGLVSNNAAVIIGGMLLMPLLSPILSLAIEEAMAAAQAAEESAKLVDVAEDVVHIQSEKQDGQSQPRA